MHFTKLFSHTELEQMLETIPQKEGHQAANILRHVQQRKNVRKDFACLINIINMLITHCNIQNITMRIQLEDEESDVKDRADGKKKETIEELMSTLSTSILDNSAIEVTEPKSSTNLTECAKNCQILRRQLLVNESNILNYIFHYGWWLVRAKKLCKEQNLLFTNWLSTNCDRKHRQLYKYMKFYSQFKLHRKILGSSLSFNWFVKNGQVISSYLKRSSHGDEFK